MKENLCQKTFPPIFEILVCIVILKLQINSNEELLDIFSKEKIRRDVRGSRI